MSQLKEVNGELTAVIFTTRREKEALEREARFLGIYTNVKNKIVIIKISYRYKN